MSLLRWSGLWLVACFLVLGLSSSTPAAERKIWLFNNGSYMAGEAKKWVERVGEKTFTLTEKNRTSDYIELYDSDRVQWVRLYNHHAEARKRDEVKWKELYKGKWDK